MVWPKFPMDIWPLFANISEFRVIDFWKMVMEKPWNYYVWDELLRTLAEDIL